jgi:hypothetical protein
MGDFGTGGKVQSQVAEAMRARQPELFVTLGDNAYSSGTEQEFQSNFFEPMTALLAEVPLFATPGNHEYVTNQGQPYLDNLYLPTSPSGGERYYSFDWGHVHFVALDSNCAIGLASPERCTLAAQRKWLEADLAASEAAWKVVFFHHPPWSSGEHGSQLKMRREFTPLFEKYGVDLVLTGHDHNYERSHPLKGEAVASSGARGIAYLVVGSGGASLRDFETSKPSWSAMRNNRDYGYLDVEVEEGRLSARLLTPSGAVVDSFTLTKELPPLPAPEATPAPGPATPPAPQPAPEATPAPSPAPSSPVVTPAPPTLPPSVEEPDEGEEDLGGESGVGCSTGAGPRSCHWGPCCSPGPCADGGASPLLSREARNAMRLPMKRNTRPPPRPSKRPKPAAGAPPRSRPRHRARSVRCGRTSSSRPAWRPTGFVRHEGRLADRALDFTLRRKTNLYSNERRAVAERVYGLLRRQRTRGLPPGQARSGFERLDTRTRTCCGWPSRASSTASARGRGPHLRPAPAGCRHPCSPSPGRPPRWRPYRPRSASRLPPRCRTSSPSASSPCSARTPSAPPRR